MFPNANSVIYRNEEGEVLGWDQPNDDPPDYCDDCGIAHHGPCRDYEDEDED